MIRYFDEMFESLALLCGKRDERFEGETSLRQFQFKLWLRSNVWAPDCYNDAGRLFTAVTIREQMKLTPAQLLQDGYRKTPSQAIIAAIKNERALFNVTFASRDLLGIPGEKDYERIFDQSQTDMKEISDLSALVDWHIRVAVTGNGILPMISNAWLAYGEFERIRKERSSKTALVSVLEQRLQRLPFSYVAGEVLPELLTIDASLEKEVVQSSQLAKEKWITYCQGVLYVMKTLEDDELERFKQAVDLTERSWRKFDPMSQDELDSAGIKPDGRRPASETKKKPRLSRPKSI